MAALPRRIVKETQKLLSEPAPGISATPHEDNLRYFNVIIAGPDQSPFEGGIFNLELFLPEEYPMVPPKVRFLTKIYHPNIDRLGRICLDILKDKWSPALQIRTVLLSIQALLSAPNPDDPLANDVADAWKKNEKAAIETEMRLTRFLRNVVPPPLLTRSHYEYVKNFELPDSLLPQTFLVVRLDGKGFTKFSRDHGFRKPFDLRSIGLFNKCAEHTMQQFPEIMLAYGHSDEYSFVLPKDTDLFNRRASKIATSFASTYASSFVYYWHEFFGGGDTKQQQQQQQQLPVDVNTGYETMSPTGAEPPPMMPHYPPAFDGRVVCYPTFPLLRDYLSWRQADCHFNNLYNTLYWTIIKRWGKTHEEACALIKGKTAAEQDAMLFSQFDVRYPRLPTLFRMGSILVRKEDKEQQQQQQQQQQEQHQQPQYHSSNNINNRKEKRKKDRGRSGSGSSSSSTQNKKIVLVQTELGFNSEAFWKEHAPEFITATDTTSSS